MRSVHVPVVLSPGEDGFVVATCPVIPGCTTQGATRDEAMANLREAIELALDCMADEGWTLPQSYEFADITIAA
ncbi:MAG: type II toxin-antitoxin system HicB family antitoxin [Deltaproteobacteria bacterium]|nr:type II toxin-antitoxin system HicB family antitoxin [Deltaproteobacteria bacterium]